MNWIKKYNDEKKNHQMNDSNASIQSWGRTHRYSNIRKVAARVWVNQKLMPKIEIYVFSAFCGLLSQCTHIYAVGCVHCTIQRRVSSIWKFITHAFGCCLFYYYIELGDLIYVHYILIWLHIAEHAIFTKHYFQTDEILQICTFIPSHSTDLIDWNRDCFIVQCLYELKLTHIDIWRFNKWK